MVILPVEAGEKNFDYNVEVELINSVADTVATATFQGTDVDWYIKVNDIILKKPAGNHLNPPKHSPGIQ